MAKPKHAPYLAIKTDVQKDPCFRVLGQIAGYNEYEALGRMTHLWAWCRDRKLLDAPQGVDSYVVAESVVVLFLGDKGVHAILAAGVDDFALGERFGDGILLRGTNATVTALRNSVAGGNARAAGSRSGGQFSKPTAGTGLATGWQKHQRVTSGSPAGAPPEHQRSTSGSPAGAGENTSPPSAPPSSYHHSKKRECDAGSTDYVRRLESDTWKAAASTHRALKAQGIDPNAVDFPPMAMGEGATQLRARILELASTSDKQEEAWRQLMHVLSVRNAESERTRTLYYFKPTNLWSSTPFWHAAAMSIEDARNGPPQKSKSASTKPPNHKTGRIEPAQSSELPDGGDQTI